MVGFFPSTVRFRWMHYKSVGCDWVADSGHECGCLGVCGSVPPAPLLCWDHSRQAPWDEPLQVYDVLCCLVSVRCPLDATEQRMSTWETEWEIHFFFFLIIVASSLANKDKNIPSTFYVCTSQIMLSSNPNVKCGRNWLSFVSFLLA